MLIFLSMFTAVVGIIIGSISHINAMHVTSYSAKITGNDELSLAVQLPPRTYLIKFEQRPRRYSCDTPRTELGIEWSLSVDGKMLVKVPERSYIDENFFMKTSDLSPYFFRLEETSDIIIAITPSPDSILDEDLYITIYPCI